MTWEPTNELRFVTRAYSPPTSVSGYPPPMSVQRVLQQKWRRQRTGDTDQFEWRDVPLVQEDQP